MLWLTGSAFFVGVLLLLRQLHWYREQCDRFSKIAHDLQSPISALNVVLESVPLTSIDRRHARHIFFQVTSLSRALMSEAPLSGARTALMPLLEELVVQKRIEYASGKLVSISLEVAAAFSHCFVAIPKTELTRVLSNLLNNAHESIQEQGEIRIEATFYEEAIRITIRDNGRGLSPKRYRELNRGQGAGHGIRGAHQILHHWKGRLQLAPNPESGTQAIVTLPLE